MLKIRVRNIIKLTLVVVLLFLLDRNLNFRTDTTTTTTTKSNQTKNEILACELFKGCPFEYKILEKSRVENNSHDFE